MDRQAGGKRKTASEVRSGPPAATLRVPCDINCAVIGFTAKAPTENLEEPVPNSQFPPR